MFLLFYLDLLVSESKEKVTKNPVGKGSWNLLDSYHDVPCMYTADELPCQINLWNQIEEIYVNTCSFHGHMWAYEYMISWDGFVFKPETCPGRVSMLHPFRTKEVVADRSSGNGFLSERFTRKKGQQITNPDPLKCFIMLCTVTHDGSVRRTVYFPTLIPLKSTNYIIYIGNIYHTWDPMGSWIFKT